VTHQRGGLDVGTDHHPRGVDQRHQRQAERVAELHEPCRLVGAVGVDRPGQMSWIVGDHAHRSTLDAGECGDHPDAELAPQLQHGVDVEEPGDRPPDVVGAEPVDRDDVAQRRLVRRRPVGRAALEVRQVLLGDGDGFLLVGHDHVDDPVGPLHLDRPDRRRLVHPEPPPSIIAGPPIPMLASSVAITTSQQPRMAALPAKQ
jgi:hypothetical protein